MSRWLYRKRVTLPAIPGDAGPLVDVPFPIKIPVDNDIGKVGQADGGDLRVTDASGVTQLPFDRAHYICAGGVAFGLLFAKLPVYPSAGTHAYLYFGNDDAEDGQDADGTWDDYLGVYHFVETGAPATLADSTANENDLTNNGTDYSDAGILLQARDFVAANTDSLTVTQGDQTTFTLSCWIKFDDVTADRAVFSNSGSPSWQVWMDNNGDSDRIGFGNPAGAVYGGSIAVDTWYYVTMVCDAVAETVDIWLDDTKIIDGHDVSGGVPGLEDVSFGKYSTSKYHDGLISECRITTETRSGTWIALQRALLTDPPALGALERVPAVAHGPGPWPGQILYGS